MFSKSIAGNQFNLVTDKIKFKIVAWTGKDLKKNYQVLFNLSGEIFKCL